jgi:hypothetical protein
MFLMNTGSFERTARPYSPENGTLKASLLLKPFMFRIISCFLRDAVPKSRDCWKRFEHTRLETFGSQ